jgi:hypothetical protein
MSAQRQDAFVSVAGAIACARPGVAMVQTWSQPGPEGVPVITRGQEDQAGDGQRRLSERRPPPARRRPHRLTRRATHAEREPCTRRTPASAPNRRARSRRTAHEP